jgi:hypothetical protein
VQNEQRKQKRQTEKHIFSLQLHKSHLFLFDCEELFATSESRWKDGEGEKETGEKQNEKGGNEEGFVGVQEQSQKS